MTTKRTNPALAVSLLVISCLQLGCYVSHVAWGQMRLLRARQPIAELLADPTTPSELRGQLEVVTAVRTYAAAIGLSVDGNYTSYAPWPGDRVVTTLVATQPGEVEPAGFWFPVVGRLPYKGFFDPERAEWEADRLREDGLDVCVVAVPAYSTLGWFDDPVTGPMLRADEGRLVETLLHELVHATVFLPDEADFNEGVAAFLGEEASVRFYAERGDTDAAHARRDAVEDARRVDVELMALRSRVEALYASDLSDEERSTRRAQHEREARERISALTLHFQDATRLAEGARLNDACLALAATYTADVPRYASLLDALGGNLPAFVERLHLAADAEDARAALLENLPDPPTR